MEHEYDLGALFLQYDEDEAQAEYELFQEAFKEMHDTGKSERLEAFINNRMAQAIPTELTAEEKLDKLYEIIVPHLGKMLELSALKDKYDELGTPEELTELVDTFNEVFEKVETLVAVHDNMCIEAEDYEAKGWHIVLVDDASFEAMKKDPSLCSGGPAKMITERTERLFSLEDEDEFRELNFFYRQ